MGCHQTPISFLQEVCAKWSIQPSYEFFTSRAPNKALLFNHVCLAGNEYRSSACGPNKKRSKHQAALGVLLQLMTAGRLTVVEQETVHGLQGCSSGSALPASNLSSSVGLNRGGEGGALVKGPGTGTSTAANSLLEDLEAMNIVGQLQEWCQKQLWPQPSYQFSQLPNVLGNAGLQEYSCQVSLWKWTETATARSKKFCKRMAASQLLARIKREKLTIPAEALALAEENGLGLLCQSTSSEQKTASPPNQDLPSTNASSQEENSARYFEMLAKHSNRVVEGLWNKKGKRIYLTVDWAQATRDPEALLESLSLQQELGLIFSYNSQTKSGSIVCQIQICSLPTAGIVGSAASRELARRSAAYNCLLYLSVMCRPQRRVRYPLEFDPSLQNMVESMCAS